MQLILDSVAHEFSMLQREERVTYHGKWKDIIQSQISQEMDITENVRCFVLTGTGGGHTGSASFRELL